MKHEHLTKEEFLRLISEMFEFASHQMQKGDERHFGMGKTLDVDVDESQKSKTDEDLATDKRIWVYNMPIIYSPVSVEQEDDDEQKSSTAQAMEDEEDDEEKE